MTKTTKKVVKRFENIAGMIELILAKYYSMDIEKLIEHQNRVLNEMIEARDESGLVDTDLTMELYFIDSLIFDKELTKP